MAALAASLAATAGATTSVTVLSTRNSALGEILVSAGGRTLYHDSAERRGVVRCVGACAVTWPPLVISARATPLAGRGVTESLLGTVRRPDGRLQVTYRGLPLYLYSGDTRAGQANGQDVGGSWHALSPAGAVVTTKAPTGSVGSTPATGTMTTGSTGPGPGVNPGMWCAANPQSCVNGQPVTH
jgi:predicted lipoprotein with Yx(FWY)xxD motif